MKTHTRTHTICNEEKRKEKENSSLFLIENGSQINLLMVMSMMMKVVQQVYMYKMVIDIDDAMDVVA